MVFCAKPGKAYISRFAEIKIYTEEKAKSILYFMRSVWVSLNN